MTVTETTNIKKTAFAGDLMNKFIYTRCGLGVLRFFAVHPKGRFSKLAVVHAIDEARNRLEVENTLDQMLTDGILRINVENNTCFYALTADETVRRSVCGLGVMDWRDWRFVLDHV